jgi:alkenylglycerophosphocholine/alkenylglycerophosphoethanolamine hydrolase
VPGRVLLALGVAAAAVHLAGLALDLPAVRLVSKPLPVLLLAAWVLSAGTGGYARLVAAGLVLSALGDVLLERDALFRHGLAAFLCAHVCYTIAFVRDAPALHGARAVPFLAYGLAAFAFLRPGLGALTPYVGVYMAAICAMMWRAAARVGHDGIPQAGEWAALAGSIVFAASDTLIAVDRFHAPVPGVRYPIILLYWIGQLGIAASAVPGLLPLR